MNMISYPWLSSLSLTQCILLSLRIFLVWDIPANMDPIYLDRKSKLTERMKMLDHLLCFPFVAASSVPASNLLRLPT
jgi:hypothetical protein